MRESGSGVIKGRGAPSNAESRFLPTTSVPIDDGWARDEEAPPKLETTVLPDRTKRLITRNHSPDIRFSQSINPYKGCEHGCVYCFARPTHAYLDLSPGLDFETRLFYKTEVRAHLCQELGRTGYQPATLAMGTNTDPYQPVEQHRGVTREVLETLLEVRHPVSIVTKSALILRDLDLLRELAKLNLVSVHISVTTLERSLKVLLEPRTASPNARLRVIETLAQAGVPVGAMIAPVIPFVNDHEIENMVAAVAGAGARASAYILLRLPHEVKELFDQWLAQHLPLKRERVLAAIRDTRQGKLYQSGWGQRMRGSGPVAELLASRFAAAHKKHGLGDLPELTTQLFRRPCGGQQSLF